MNALTAAPGPQAAAASAETAARHSPATRQVPQPPGVTRQSAPPPRTSTSRAVPTDARCPTPRAGAYATAIPVKRRNAPPMQCSYLAQKVNGRMPCSNLGHSGTIAVRSYQPKHPWQGIGWGLGRSAHLPPRIAAALGRYWPYPGPSTGPCCPRTGGRYLARKTGDGSPSPGACPTPRLPSEREADRRAGA